MRMSEAIREATQGCLSNPCLLLPLAVALAFGLLTWLVGLLPIAAVGTGLNLVETFLAPAFLAWWVGWAGEAAVGRRLHPSDLVPTLSRNVAPMYMLLFVYSIGTLVLSRIIPFFAVIALLAPLILNPWIDFAAEGDVRLERMTRRMRDPVYWLVAASGLILAACGVFAEGFAGGLLGAGFLGSVLPGAFPPLSLALLIAYAVATWLWAVRSRLLSDPGVWQSSRMRRFMRESRRTWDDDD
jgi:hypothetical protein